MYYVFFSNVLLIKKKKSEDRIPKSNFLSALYISIGACTKTLAHINLKTVQHKAPVCRGIIKS